MFEINGAIQILPSDIKFDIAEIGMNGEDGEKDTAIVMNLITTSGLVRIILPVMFAKQLPDAIEDAIAQANDKFGSGLQIVSDLKEINKLTKERG